MSEFVCNHGAVVYSPSYTRYTSYTTGTAEGGIQEVCTRCFAVLHVDNPSQGPRLPLPPPRTTCEACVKEGNYALYRTSHFVEGRLLSQWLCYTCKRVARPVTTRDSRPENWSRALAMWALRQDGLTLKAIGALFSTSIENTRRILMVDVPAYIRSEAHKRNTADVEQREQTKIARNRVLDIDDPEVMQILGF